MDCVPGHPTWCEHGRLIVASPLNIENDDLENYLIEQASGLGFQYAHSMSTYLEQRDVSLNLAQEKKFPQYHLIEVPLVKVFDVVNGLYRGLPGTKARIDSIEPDQILDISAPPVRLGTKFNLFALGSEHGAYKSSLNAVSPMSSGNPVDGSGVKIAIIDTGLETGKAQPASYNDFIAPRTAQNDADGHGTAMIEIVKDIAPSADIHVYRVTHATTVFIWDLMAAVLAAAYDKNVDVISLSLGCKNLSSPCKICGGHSQNRSAVCERLFQLIRNDVTRNAIVVASVGNDGPSKAFEWPAVCDGVLGVGAVNRSDALSSFSNSGVTQTSTTDFCLLPGGDEPSGNITEFVGEGQDGGNSTYCYGTSAATAYAAGILALRKHHDMLSGSNRDKGMFLSWLAANAKHTVRDASGNIIYNSATHGMGLLDYTPTLSWV